MNEKTSSACMTNGMLRAFAVLSIVFCLAACRNPEQDSISARGIRTLEPFEKNKTVITIRAEFNENLSFMEEALEKKFPDTDIVFTFHCARETQYELRRSLESGTAEDIIISPSLCTVNEIAPQTLLDLSGEDFTASYSGALLDECTIRGHIYYLPGPSDTYGIICDKTMFDEHGWTIPRSWTDFVSVCAEISKTGIRAFQPSCRYARQAQLVFTAFCYDDVFGGIDNQDRISEYRQGKIRMKDHFGPAFEKYRELYSLGLIRPDDFGVEPGNRSRMMYQDHTCAMIIENQMAQFYARRYRSDHEYVMIPFWCGDSPENGHVTAVSNYYIAANALLARKQNRKKLEKVRAILSYLSTPEGQKAAAGGHIVLPPPIEGMEIETNSFNKMIHDTVQNGGLAAEVRLMDSGNNNPAEKALQKGLRLYLEGGMTADQVMDSCDKARDDSLALGFVRGSTVGTASDDFTNMETALFIADVFRKKTGADIGLCLAGQTDCGTVSRIYKGAVSSKDIETLDLSIGPRSDDPDDKKLWVISLTGSQLLDLLRQPYLHRRHPEEYREPYFTASGLRIVFAPQAPVGTKLVSVTLADGTPLDMDRTYTAAMWCWPDFGFTCPYDKVRVYDDSFEQIMTQAIQSEKGVLSPFSDGRMKLVRQY
jgi:raffinose/stachyose/melibiose transport system substrate-binding protein